MANRFYLDVEFDVDELVSLALVPADVDRESFYIVTKRVGFKNPWVAEHVAPILDTAGPAIHCGPRDAPALVAMYLGQGNPSDVEIVADWFTDFLYLLRLIDHGDGTCEEIPALTMRVVRGDCPSALPHNALMDAMGIRDVHERSAAPTRAEGGAMSNNMVRHFVRFFSPGTFFAETSERPIGSWNVDTAIEMARDVTERYGATPYGLCFVTRERGPDDLDSKETKTSKTYFLGGKVETLEEIEARNDPKESILLSNMRCNGWKRVVVNTNSWKCTQPLNDDDTVLDFTPSRKVSP